MARPNRIAQLKAGGFEQIGCWELDPQQVAQFAGEIPEGPGVYAIIVDNEVRYIGSTHRGLRLRFLKYRNVKNMGRLAVRIRKNITEELQAGAKVRVFAAVCESTHSPWNGLPVDLTAGLEIGLIRDWHPPWNKRSRIISN